MKLDLAVILLLLMCLWFAVSIAPLPARLELPLLFSGSAAGGLWLAWRTRRALARARAELTAGGGADGEK